ncbi:MAG: copper chaperone PCu(A)C [Rhodospirillales bacterium]|nr:copper chaperone PCu(A)C [Rhodospirillales bacterium]
MLRRIAFAILLSLAPVAAMAQQGPIRVETAWARASAGEAKNGAAYLTLHNTGTAPDKLLSAASPVAGKVELHNHIMVGNVAQMRPVDAIEVSPGSPTVLQPGGLHVMLLDLKAPLKAGQSFPVTLTFERAGKIEANVAVQAIRAPAPTAPRHGHGS